MRKLDNIIKGSNEGSNTSNQSDSPLFEAAKASAGNISIKRSSIIPEIMIKVRFMKIAP